MVNLEAVGIQRKTIWNKYCRNRAAGCEMDSTGSGQDSTAGSSEHSNELFGSIKDGEFD